ncbi:hypothetical protein [Teredinibacter sp. KSP-S5-2]|uniref:hypothetical protein n=1 Tax=Teredinibacter sp. KSP-S5-2 TaxID=3034506 RepID=UPI0029343230|nr:hypothetical protein [Teredinibacter sp. KSP-S5-2]WNO08772.1 hypothetical protein P5V12_17515 [Teredinibacter sp. KSP-S5-2]
MSVKKINRFTVVACLAVGALFATSGSYGGDTINAGCMQDLAGFTTNCTANDVAISGVATNPDGTHQLTIHDDGCAYQGDTVTFTATFDLEVTAKERHDIGIYFATDGDLNGDGAVSGSCSVSTLDYQPDPPWLDLDGTTDPFPGTNIISNVQDTCGDIDKPGHNPLHPTVTLTAVCKDDDNDGFLNLPNCTSWRQSGANELCTSPLDAFPGAPSKCRCDEGFNVPISVPPAQLKVVKTASPTSLVEPGGVVTFTVSTTNTGVDPNNGVTINAIMDSIYGDVTTSGHDNIISTTCSVPQFVPVDDGNVGGVDTYTCSFQVNLSGNAGDTETNIVTSSGTDTHGNAISGQDDATVTITDELPSISVTKTPSVNEVLEPGGNVTFSVSVTNTSLASSDTVIISLLTDSIYGDLNGKGTCSAPQTIAPGATYNCSFTEFVAGNAGYTETDVVTASGADDEGNAVSDSDSATVVVNDVPSSISVVKVADPIVLPEPGGNVTFSVLVSNGSAVDTVIINSLVDDIHGDLNGQGNCLVPQTLLPGESYSCSFMVFVAGDANTSETDVVTATGTDDDSNVLMAADDATVDFENVAPAATVTKTATSATVTYQVSVRNDSSAESLNLNQLMDNMFGDITQVQGAVVSTTCVVPQVLAISGQANDTYSCSFDALVGSSPHTNTVTATVGDNDGSTAVTPSDSATVTLE